MISHTNAAHMQELCGSWLQCSVLRTCGLCQHTLPACACQHSAASTPCLLCAQGPSAPARKTLLPPPKPPGPHLMLLSVCMFCMCVDAVRTLDPCVQHVKHMLSVLHSPLGASLEGARSCSALCPHSPANEIVALHTCLLLSCRQLTVVLLAWTQHMPCKHTATCVRN
jgi:hypothetical protein